MQDTTLTDRIAESIGDRVDDLRHLGGGDPEVIEVGPSWGARLGWLAFGAALGATAALLADPERGRQRREQLAARSRDVAEDVAGRTKQVAGQARGTLAGTVDAITPQDVPDDPTLLRQKVRTEVFGAREDVQDVVIRVDGPGHVALKGTVPTPAAEESLVAEVEKVEGVVDVTSELMHRGV